jgi:formylglycine-generating enzyme required for sulfatase activity
MTTEHPAELLHRAALDLERRGHLPDAAAALDAAFGLDPAAEEVCRDRARLLDRLAVVEHGLRFRYIPAGPFRMGDDCGELDERPAHIVDLPAFWIAELPTTWAAYCRLRGWSPPPLGMPPEREEEDDVVARDLFYRHQENKIRLQYCESATTQARNWHAHLPDSVWTGGDSTTTTSRELFGEAPRERGAGAPSWDEKPMVAVAWDDAVAVGAILSRGDVTYRLPTEAEWEKAARGGLARKRYPWGDDPPTTALCDHGRFGDLSIQPPRRFPPNDYGLFSMAGGVWEWTSDAYDALAYHREGAPPPDGAHRVLRGGSWSDCAAAVRVSFRMSLPLSEGGGGWGAHMSPNVGFRLVRVGPPPRPGAAAR